MKIAISGSHGLVGHHLRNIFANDHHHIVTLGRAGSWVASEIENCDLIIHLAGANISAGRWTKKIKNDIFSSRVEGTQQLVALMGTLKNPPPVFMCASAIGYYGHESSGPLTESSAPGKTFLADVCVHWEAAARSAALINNMRVITLRFAPILSTTGGMLKAMLPVFKAGLGGPIANGTQSVSWITLEEIPRIIYFLLAHPEISGPVNCSSPHPVSNLMFSQTLARLLKRPCCLPVPEIMVRLLFGEMGQELLLSGAKVLPAKLESAGYQFNEPHLNVAMDHLLK